MKQMTFADAEAAGHSLVIQQDFSGDDSVS